MEFAAPFLQSGSWQGVSGIVAIVTLGTQVWLTVWAARRTPTARPASAPNAPIPPTAPMVTHGRHRVAGALFVWAASGVFYCFIWVVLAVGFRYSPAQILALVGAPSFVALAVLPGLGAVLARWPHIGAAVGGSIPLMSFVMYNLSDPVYGESYLATAPPLAWFVVSAVLGGLFGAAAGGSAIGLAHAFRLPLPREPARADR